MQKLIASLFAADFVAAPALADCSISHSTTAQTPVPMTVGTTTDTTKTKTEPGTGA